jgi:acyl-CoA synthetase (AMP-forming)/AMP-acid ligase II
MFDFSRLKSVADIPRIHAKERPDAVALDYNDRTTSYAQLDERTNRVAQGLIAAGATPGARVGYLGKNVDRYFEVLLGAFKARAVIVGVNWRLAPPEIAYVLNDADCEMLFVGKDFYAIVEKILPDCPRLKTVVAMDGEHALWPSFEQWREAQPAKDPMLPIGADDDVIQLYTSGTTGHPKGVQLTNANYLAVFACLGSMPIGNYEPHDVVLIAMPFFHVAGVNIGLLSLAQGARGIVLGDIDPTEILRLIRDKRITYAFLVPAVILFLLQHADAAKTDFSSIKNVSYGASPISDDVLLRAQEVFGCEFLQVYGLTETTGGGTFLAPEDHVPSRGKLRSWFHTGHAGFFDEEGYLYIHDRVKDMIVSGGENIYPAEVENALFGHPGVADAAVIGVPDARWGEAVKAIVVWKEGASPDPAEIIAWARERIAGYKLPKSVDFVETIPRNPSGKVLRRELRKPYWEGRDRQVN